MACSLLPGGLVMGGVDDVWLVTSMAVKTKHKGKSVNAKRYFYSLNRFLWQRLKWSHPRFSLNIIDTLSDI